MNEYLAVPLIFLFILLLLGADDILDALLSGRRKPRPKTTAKCKHDWQVSYTLSRSGLNPSGIVCSKCKQQRPLGTGGKQNGRRDGKKGGIGAKWW